MTRLAWAAGSIGSVGQRGELGHRHRGAAWGRRHARDRVLRRPTAFVNPSTFGPVTAGADMLIFASPHAVRRTFVHGRLWPTPANANFPTKTGVRRGRPEFWGP